MCTVARLEHPGPPITQHRPRHSPAADEVSPPRVGLLLLHQASQDRIGAEPVPDDSDEPRLVTRQKPSKETLFTDRQVYSRSVHVVLQGSVQEVRERMLGRQQTGSMQDPASGVRRIPLPRTLVNKGKREGRGKMPRPFRQLQ